MEEQNIRELYAEITRTLADRKLSITTMESATSGQIASLITDTEGASAVMKGAFITYSNEAKIRQGVPAEVIEKYGVYSTQTAEAMAAACQKTWETDFSIGVTGTYGNVDPNNPDSVPGLVYYAIRYQNNVLSRKIEIKKQPSRYAYKLCTAKAVGEDLLGLLLKE